MLAIAGLIVIIGLALWNPLYLAVAMIAVAAMCEGD